MDFAIQLKTRRGYRTAAHADNLATAFAVKLRLSRYDGGSDYRIIPVATHPANYSQQSSRHRRTLRDFRETARSWRRQVAADAAAW